MISRSWVAMLGIVVGIAFVARGREEREHLAEVFLGAEESAHHDGQLRIGGVGPGVQGGDRAQRGVDDLALDTGRQRKLDHHAGTTVLLLASLRLSGLLLAGLLLAGTRLSRCATAAPVPSSAWTRCPSSTARSLISWSFVAW